MARRKTRKATARAPAATLRSTSKCPVCHGTTGRNTPCTRPASCKIGCVRLCWQHAIAYVPKGAHGTGKCLNLLPPPTANATASANVSRRRAVTAEPTVRLNPAVKALNAHVVVKHSTIPAAGQGLFATKAFAVGDVVATYGGVVMHVDEWQRLPVALRNYGMGIEGQRNYIIDGTKSYGAHMGRWANDPYRTNHALNVKAKWNEAHKRMEFKATKPIANGAEIFINYGPGFHQRL